MFRKPKGGTKKNKNVRTRKDDEEEDNDEGTTEFDTGASIRKTMHKQKLLASLPMTTSSLMVNNHNGRGTGATHQSTVVAAGVDTNDTGTGVYIKSRSAYTDTGAPAELSVLEKKHQENMESFISAKVGGGDNDENNTKNHTRKTLLRTTMTDEDLYRQLAQDVTNGGGSGEKDDTAVAAASQGSDGDGANNSNTTERDNEETGVLVGSGIAEVILPTMTRHDSTAGQGNTAFMSKYQSSAIPAAERHKHAMPDTIPKPLAKFRKQYSTPFQNTNNQDHNNTNTTTNTSNPNTTTTTTTNATKEEEAQQTKTDQTRAGFQSFIGKGSVAAATAENQAREAEQQQYNNHNKHNPNNSNNPNHNKRKWQTGQSRDDQAYAHFLKTAIAGRRMR